MAWEAVSSVLLVLRTLTCDAMLNCVCVGGRACVRDENGNAVDLYCIPQPVRSVGGREAGVSDERRA